MPEIALATPFDASEVKDIACQEFRKLLDQNSLLMGLREYNHFEIDFGVIKIKLSNPANMSAPKETIVWGKKEFGEPSAADLDSVAEEVEIKATTFSSGDPNEERQARGLPLTVEVSDGHGGKTRKKVRVA